MPTARLADRQIRAAAHAALRLDVRGPVSEALARTGIVVPPADGGAEEAPPRATAAPDRPARPTRGLQSRSPKPLPVRHRLPPATPADGLTADERRVHRILVEALEREIARQDSGLSMMRYAERTKLEALDLAYLNAEIASMTTRRRLAERLIKGTLAVGVIGLPFVAGAMLWAGLDQTLPVLTGLVTLLAGLGASLAVRPGPPKRLAIYEALRELAYAADPGEHPAETVAEADRLIDQLAGPALSAAPARLLDSSDRLPDAGAPAPHRRIRTH